MRLRPLTPILVMACTASRPTVEQRSEMSVPAPVARIEVYADSVRVEDRDPERREEQWGVVILSDSLYDQLSKWKHLTVVLKTPQYRTQRANIALDGFNALKPVLDSPTCTGR